MSRHSLSFPRCFALFLCCTFLCLLCTSCIRPVQVNAPGLENALPLLGADESVVVNELGLTAVQPNTIPDSSVEEYVIDSAVDGNDCTVSLTFCNEVFASLGYTFPDTQGAFAYAVKMREALGEQYGNTTTDPIQSEVQHSFDELTSAGELKPSQLYYEDWAAAADSTQMEKMLDGVPTERIDIRFSLFTLENGGIVSVRYSPILADSAESEPAV